MLLWIAYIWSVRNNIGMQVMINRANPINVARNSTLEINIAVARVLSSMAVMKKAPWKGDILFPCLCQDIVKHYSGDIG
jgi:hypothetical protein